MREVTKQIFKSRYDIRGMVPHESKHKLCIFFLQMRACEQLLKKLCLFLGKISKLVVDVAFIFVISASDNPPSLSQ